MPAKPRYKFINRNSFPVGVPGKRGINITFGPGQWATDPWYGQFVGKRNLSREPINPGEQGYENSEAVTLDKKDELWWLKTKEAEPPAKAEVPVVPLKAPIDVVKATSEETIDYVKKMGIYVCKHCATFRTGSLRAFKMHLSSYHQMGGEPLIKPITVASKPDIIEAAAEEVARPVVDTDVDFHTGDADEPDYGEPGSPVPAKESGRVVPLGGLKEDDGVAVTTSKGFACDTCGRSFGSEPGLRRHITVKHGRKE